MTAVAVRLPVLALAASPGRRAARFAAVRAGGEVVADQLRLVAEGVPVVTASPRAAYALLERFGVSPRPLVWDVLELAALLRPECPTSSLDRAAAFFGLTPDGPGLECEARLTLTVFEVLLDALEQVDTPTLLHASRLALPLDWPLRALLSQVEQARARSPLETGVLAEATPIGGWIAQGAPPRSRRRPPPEPSARRPAALDPDEIADHLAPNGGIAHALPAYEPRPEQVAMAQRVATTLTRGGQALIEAPTGVGKALDVDTPIPTPTGWTRMGDLQVGDLVFDERGRPTRVSAAFEIMYDRPCHEVEFSDGSKIVADAEHEWATYTCGDRAWAARPRNGGHAGRNFVDRATLGSLRAELTAVPQASTLTRREAESMLGGHSWSVRWAATRVGPAARGLVPRYATRDLLVQLLRQLESDFAKQRRDGHAYSLLTTQQIAASLTVGATHRLNHAVPVAAPLNLPSASLPIDPYFLGAWLGDGSSRCAQITSADREVLLEIERAGYTARPLPSQTYQYAVDDENGKPSSRWQVCMTSRLRALGVLQNKHIPEAYLRASEPQRRALLAGLLDTDGTVSANGAVQFTTTNPRLAVEFHELACSLGFRPTTHMGRARLYGKACGPKWTVHLTTDQPVFRLARKAEAQRQRLRNYAPKRNRFRYIVRVRPAATRPVRCIQVESASHLYLAGRAFIPTHNSVAYLLPAVLQAVRNRQRVVVSTATITLQDQLFEKDLPTVQAALGDGVALRATVLKGRGNYLCLRRWQTLLHATDLSPDDRLLLIKTLFWLPRTRTGDRAELRLTPGEEQAWQRLSAVTEACTPQRCPYHRIGVCFLARARRAAEDSHIVITNHALLLSDLVTRSRVLPDYQALILDEAHHLEDEATQQLGWRIGERELLGRLERLWSPGAPASGAVAEALALIASAHGLRVPGELLADLERGEQAVLGLGTAVRQFFESLGDLLADSHLAGDETALRITSGVRAGSRWQELETIWAEATEYLQEVERLAGLVQGHLVGVADQASVDLGAELASQLDGWADVRRRLGSAVHTPEPSTVYWIAGRPSGRTAWLSAAPLEVAQLLRDKLFAPTESSLLVSATLSIDSSFEYVKRRLGLEEAADVALGSPFDYRRNALLYIPNDLPDPTQPGHQALLERVLLETVGRLGGRTLVLFTSRAHLRSTYTALREPLARLGITLLGQGINEGSRTRLLDTFRRGSRVALFGTNAFWEGIDVVGDALSCVVVSRLPFAVPTDPIYAARAEQFEDPFAEYAVPQAVLRLKQGFGRLIRSRSDRGAVVVMDRRLVTRFYGQVFVRSLPACCVKQGPASRTAIEVGEWVSRQPTLVPE